MGDLRFSGDDDGRLLRWGGGLIILGVLVSVDSDGLITLVVLID